MAHLSESDIDALREMLETERLSLQQGLAVYGKKDEITGEWEGASADETTMEEADPIDAADQIEELVVNVPLVADLQKRLHEVEAALHRMEEDTYGICEISGEEIPLARLKANPAARTTVEHAEGV